jgi:hypothetical protein
MEVDGVGAVASLDLQRARTDTVRLRPFVLLSMLGMLILASTGCEESTPTPEQSESPATTAPATHPAIAPAPTTLPGTMIMPATTRAMTSGPATTRAASSRPVDPLATPEGAVSALLELAQKPKVPALEAVLPLIVEPPPDEELVQKLNAIRVPLLRGATWEITDSLTHGSAAVVLYTIKPPPGRRGRALTIPILVLQRYGRWKMVFGQLTPLRYTEGEKNDMFYVMDWGQKRVPQVAATRSTSQPATQPATQPRTQPTSAP